MTTISLAPGMYLLVSPVLRSGQGVVLSSLLEACSSTNIPVLSHLYGRTDGRMPRRWVVVRNAPGVLLGALDSDQARELLALFLELGVPNDMTQLTYLNAEDM